MSEKLDPSRVALILVGFQNDYFSPEGALNKIVQQSAPNVLSNTLEILNCLKNTSVKIISTPILFTPDYSELVDPIGILKTIKETKAFRAGTVGGKAVSELQAYGDRILELPGKRGLNAFSNTSLHEVLKKERVSDVVLLGVVTSLCIESTGREAFENGYHVIIVSDATAGKSIFEHEYYCSEIFPMYAEVIDHETLIRRLGA